MVGNPAFSPNVEEMDLNQEYNFKKYCRNKTIASKCYLFSGVSIGSYTLLHTSFQALETFKKISFVRMLYVKLFFYTPHVTIEGICGIFFTDFKN
jgi:hypothetical protein